MHGHYPPKPCTLPVCRQQGKSHHLVQSRTSKLPFPLRRAERGRGRCQQAHLPPVRSQHTSYPLCFLGPLLTFHFHERNQRLKWPDLGMGRGPRKEDGGGGGRTGRGTQASSSRVHSINIQTTCSGLRWGGGVFGERPSSVMRRGSKVERCASRRSHR